LQHPLHVGNIVQQTLHVGNIIRVGQNQYIRIYTPYIW